MEQFIRKDEKVNGIPWLVKVLIAGVLAFAFLNILSFFYYNVPARVSVEDGASEYKWPAYSFHSQATEGLGFGRVNNDGYNNLADFTENSEIDVLLMGSSHFEGFNVLKDENTAAVLNRICDKTVYNIAVSEHTMLRCISNLENALKKYKPTEYVVIETMTVSFYDAEIENALNRENRLPTYSGAIMDVLQNMKYLKLVYHQYDNLKASSPKENEVLNNKALIDKLLEEANKTCEEHGVKLIVVFHPTLTFDNDNNVYALYNREDERILRESCEEKGIVFVNMEEEFIAYYKTEHKLPHGFDNTTPGAGHLNSTGHMLIAEKVKEVMEAVENDF